MTFEQHQQRLLDVAKYLVEQLPHAKSITHLQQLVAPMKRSIEELEPDYAAAQAAELAIAIEEHTDAVEAQVRKVKAERSGKLPHEIKGFKFVPSQRANDCPVVAVANVLQKTYSEAKTLCRLHGWSSTCGITRGFIEVILDKAGWDYEYREDLTHGSVNAFAGDTPRGVYLVYCSGHVMPAANGKLYNVGLSGGKAIEEVIELRPKPRQPVG
jgi:hypothetical protein